MFLRLLLVLQYYTRPSDLMVCFLPRIWTNTPSITVSIRFYIFFLFFVFDDGNKQSPSIPLGYELRHH